MSKEMNAQLNVPECDSETIHINDWTEVEDFRISDMVKNPDGTDI